ncbi:MAG: hypothetical protein SF339_09090 [Blastocatellia bacterium]|nr:hypothetical protein [Blastocatellia bacterium]
MNCREFETRLRELAAEQLMAADERARAQAHAATCPRCDARLQEERALTLGLRALAGSDAGREASPAVETALLAAFREASRPAATPMAVPGPMRWQRASWAPWALAAAAALLMACGLLVYRAARREPAPAPVAKRDVPAAPQAVASPERLPEIMAAAAPATRTPRAVRKAPAATPLFQIREEMTLYGGDGGSGEIRTEFLSLDYSENPAPMESGQVIRVQMPRAALAKYGLPVDVERADAPIKADLLVGEDGFARAIRFVR